MCAKNWPAPGRDTDTVPLPWSHREAGVFSATEVLRGWDCANRLSALSFRSYPACTLRASKDVMTYADLLEQDFGLLADLVAAHAAERSDALAVIDGERAATYCQLQTLVNRAAAGLQRDGLRPTQTIAICAASSLEYGPSQSLR